MDYLEMAGATLMSDQCLMGWVTLNGLHGVKAFDLGITGRR